MLKRSQFVQVNKGSRVHIKFPFYLRDNENEREFDAVVMEIPSEEHIIYRRDDGLIIDNYSSCHMYHIDYIIYDNGGYVCHPRPYVNVFRTSYNQTNLNNKRDVSNPFVRLHNDDAWFMPTTLPTWAGEKKGGKISYVGFQEALHFALSKCKDVRSYVRQDEKFCKMTAVKIWEKDGFPGLCGSNKNIGYILRWKSFLKWVKTNHFRLVYSPKEVKAIDKAQEERGFESYLKDLEFDEKEDNNEVYEDSLDDLREEVCERDLTDSEDLIDMNEIRAYQENTIRGIKRFVG